MNEYFVVRITDSETGRGIPLVTLQLTNGLRFHTDSNGTVAFCEPSLMDKPLLFLISSPGYSFADTVFGEPGFVIRTTPVTLMEFSMERLQAAARLHRLTGQGIYQDSQLGGLPVAELPASPVMGQDSVLAVEYGDKVVLGAELTNLLSGSLGRVVVKNVDRNACRNQAFDTFNGLFWLLIEEHQDSKVILER